MDFDKWKQKHRTSVPTPPRFLFCTSAGLSKWRVNGFWKANGFHGPNRIQPNTDNWEATTAKAPYETLKALKMWRSVILAAKDCNVLSWVTVTPRSLCRLPDLRLGLNDQPFQNTHKQFGAKVTALKWRKLAASSNAQQTPCLLSLGRLAGHSWGSKILRHRPWPLRLYLGTSKAPWCLRKGIATSVLFVKIHSRGLSFILNNAI